jgi:ABC-2 type transport system ATP-binding protein
VTLAVATAPQLNAAEATQGYISIRDASYQYRGGGAPALNHVSLEIRRGSCCGLLGPNGAGKSTLLSLLMGLQKLQTGSMRVAGYDLGADAAPVRALSALVPQDFAYYAGLTGAENLRFFAAIYGLAGSRWHERHDYCVRICGLEAMLYQRAEQYSGGMKRRLNLAIGLLASPQILYLDEPTVGIDAISRQVILAAIRALRTAGVTLIYTSHYMEEVESICDDLAIIDHGQVVAQGSTSELLRDKMGTTLVVEFALQPDQLLLGALHSWSARPLGERSIEMKLANAADLAAIMIACNERGHEIRQLQFGVGRLERRYLEILE